MSEGGHFKWKVLHTMVQQGQFFNSGNCNQLYIVDFDQIHCLQINDTDYRPIK